MPTADRHSRAAFFGFCTCLGAMNGGARLRRALTSHGQELGLPRTLAPPGSLKACDDFFVAHGDHHRWGDSSSVAVLRRVETPSSPDLQRTETRAREYARPTKTCVRLRLGIAFVLALLSLGLTGCFKVSSDVGALRDSVMKSAAAQWDEKIEIGVGPITLYLARAGLAFVDLDPEARTALHAVRGAEVGVYKLREGHEQLKRAVILSAADKAMGRRGWDRIVGVVNEGEFVAIYVRHDARSTRNVRVCLLTLNGEGMVVASARSNLEPLMEMAFKRVEWRQKGRIPIQL